ncbi:hypothetical protein BC936DRAFT_149133 [Jimgerdemannia flammicorona]|uniref:Uncharacterized protein n=1 Tax=Jimgerdemannia flammicorona TaxID=994334 RepID=A0A433DK69_9FUNG|nr:hypothetical protein BC936DRAFT_149133 [Jimgerdemannia flammicorona]
MHLQTCGAFSAEHAKLSCLLSKGHSNEQIRAFITKSLHGELTVLPRNGSPSTTMIQSNHRRSLLQPKTTPASGTNDSPSVRKFGRRSEPQLYQLQWRTPPHLVSSESHTAVMEFDAIREGHGEVKLLREAGAHFAKGETEDTGWSWLRAVKNGDMRS